MCAASWFPTSVLREYFNIRSPRPEIEQIMIVETEAGRYGFVVDMVLGDCQTVIKNLGRFYRHVQVVSGATILGNGTVALILDPERLAQEAVRAIAHGPRARPRRRLRRPSSRAGGKGRPRSKELYKPSSVLERAPARIQSRFKLLSLTLFAFPLSRQREAKSVGFKRKGGANFMPTALVSEGRKPHGAVSGNGGNGHGVRERVSEKTPHMEDDDLMLVLNEVMRLVDASKEGRLTERGKATLFNGTHREIIQNINEMLDAILLPIGEGNRVLGLIRGGNLREKVEIACKGDHEKMKNAINGVHGWLTELVAYVTKIANGDLTATMSKASEQDQIHEWLMLMKSNINALVVDANMLSDAAVEGKLGTRADASKHQGDFRKIVQGVNETLDTLVGFLDNMPAPSMIINKNYEVQYMNKAGAGLGNTTGEQLVRSKTHCYDHFRTSQCRTDKCACSMAMRTNGESTCETDAHPGGRDWIFSTPAFPSATGTARSSVLSRWSPIRRQSRRPRG